MENHVEEYFKEETEKIIKSEKDKNNRKNIHGGRLNRKSYFISSMLNTCISFILLLIIYFCFYVLNILSAFLLYLLALPLIYYQKHLMIKRAHDFNMLGKPWEYSLLGSGSIFSLLTYKLYVQKGDAIENDFGPPPGPGIKLF